MTKKYEFIGKPKTVNGVVLRRIRALVDVSPTVPKGTVGGWLELEANLSHSDQGWVADDAQVYGYASVDEDARVTNKAKVYGYARISGKALVEDEAQVYGAANVYGNATISGEARIYGGAHIYGHVMAKLRAKIYGFSSVYERAEISGDAEVYGNAHVRGQVTLTGHAKAYSDALIYGHGTLSWAAEIRSRLGWIMIGPAASSGRFTFAYLDREIGVRVVTGCFSGTIEEFRASIRETHAKNSKYLAQYLGFADLIEISLQP